MDPFWKRISPSFSSYASVIKMPVDKIFEINPSDLIWIEIRSNVLVLCSDDEPSGIGGIFNLHSNRCSEKPSEIEDFYQIKLKLNHDKVEVLYLSFLSSTLADDFVHQCRLARGMVQLSEFEPIATIGRGRWGKVIVCSYFYDEQARLFAAKEMDLRQSKNLKWIQEERLVLARQSDHPFTIKMHFAVLKGSFAYIMMDFQPGGDLYNVLRQYKMSNSDVVFYSGQMVLALEHLHSHNIIHRDLKPENILLDRHGNLKLADFGLAKILVEGKKTHTLCGSDPYLAPEIVSRQSYSFSVDFWQLGCLIFELFSGYSPFFRPSASSVQTRSLILSCLIEYPREVSFQARALLKQILVANPLKRIAFDREHWPQIKKSNFYADVDWNAVLNRDIRPPIQTVYPNCNILDNFEDEFTAESCAFESGASVCAENTHLLGFDFSSTCPKELAKMDGMSTPSSPPFC